MRRESVLSKLFYSLRTIRLGELALAVSERPNENGTIRGYANKAFALAERSHLKRIDGHRLLSKAHHLRFKLSFFTLDEKIAKRFKKRSKSVKIGSTGLQMQV